MLLVGHVDHPPVGRSVGLADRPLPLAPVAYDDACLDTPAPFWLDLGAILTRRLARRTNGDGTRRLHLGRTVAMSTPGCDPAPTCWSRPFPIAQPSSTPGGVTRSSSRRGRGRQMLDGREPIPRSVRRTPIAGSASAELDLPGAPQAAKARSTLSRASSLGTPRNPRPAPCRTAIPARALTLPADRSHEARRVRPAARSALLAPAMSLASTRSIRSARLVSRKGQRSAFITESTLAITRSVSGTGHVTRRPPRVTCVGRRRPSRATQPCAARGATIRSVAPSHRRESEWRQFLSADCSRRISPSPIEAARWPSTRTSSGWNSPWICPSAALRSCGSADPAARCSGYGDRLVAAQPRPTPRFRRRTRGRPGRARATV